MMEEKCMGRIEKITRGLTWECVMKKKYNEQ